VLHEISRCGWCGDDPLYQNYHDTVWGRPEYDARELFKKLCLDGQQAGLSWITILRKQSGYERAFFEFDPVRMARLTEEDVDRLMLNSEIVRNRLKINSLIKNAKAYLTFEESAEGFSDFLWAFVGNKPIQNRWHSMSEVPAETEESKAMSKALKKKGFSFVGPTICYAFMQAVGMVNDHLLSCHCYETCCSISDR
jgi:DNA-3-methyladenine glycosylase I